MAVYESKYRELSFYVDGKLYAFNSGSFSTTDEKVIAVLDTISDAQRIAEPKPEASESKPKTTKPKAKASSEK